MASYLEIEDFFLERFKNPEEVASFLKLTIDEYNKDEDICSLMLSLRYIVKAQGSVKELSEKINLNKQTLAKILDGKTSPKFLTVTKILKELGFHFTINKKSYYE